jgi:putative multiple sugar transport system substrate-binding protein
MLVRKFVSVFAVAGLTLSLAACGGSSTSSEETAAASAEATAAASAAASAAAECDPAEKGTIGVAMPTKSSQRWIQDGDNIKAQLEAEGYQVDLQYAEDDIPTQVSQVENMVTKGDQVLVIAAIDGTALGDILNTAEESGIPIIAYDRLIRESDAVDYYTTFDNFQVGVLQANALVEGLEATGAGPYNVELFAGSPDDNNATFFFNGAMSVLQPLIDDGTMVVKSGQTDFDTVAILRWDPATAQKRMEDILTSTYSSGDNVQGVLSPYDGLSLGILAAAKANGYGSGDKPLPVVTGQDAEVQSVKSIQADEQSSTIFKDTRELAQVTVDMITALAACEMPEVTDTTTYDNGVKVVPSYLLVPHTVFKDDIQSVLIDSGYYTEDDLK